MTAEARSFALTVALGLAMAAGCAGADRAAGSDGGIADAADARPGDVQAVDTVRDAGLLDETGARSDASRDVCGDAAGQTDGLDDASDGTRNFDASDTWLRDVVEIADAEHDIDAVLDARGGDWTTGNEWETAGDVCGPCGPEQVCWPSGICAPNRGGSCGDMGGLQPGSPWPMYGYCPTQQRRSPFAGPSIHPSIQWELAVDDWWFDDLVVAADATVYASGDQQGLHAISASGEPRWVHPMQGKGRSAAVGVDGTVYVTSSIYSFLTALHPDGSEAWSVELVPPEEGQYSDTSPPVIAGDGALYVLESHVEPEDGPHVVVLHSFAPDGDQVWASVLDRSYVPGLGFMAMGVDGTVYVAIRSVGTATLTAVSAAGDVLWRFTGGPASVGGPAPSIAADGTIYVGVTRTLYAVSPDGSEKWRLRLPSYVSGIAIGPDGTIYAGCACNELFAVRPDGVVRWSLEFPADLEAPTVDARGVIYVGYGCSWGEIEKGVWAVRPDGTKWFEISTGTRCVSQVIIAGPGIAYLPLVDGTLLRVQDKAPPQ